MIRGADPLSELFPIALGVLAVLGLVGWAAMAHARGRRARVHALERLGFRPCPQEEESLRQTVSALARNRRYEFEIREPRRLSLRGKELYYYHKVRLRHDSEPVIEEELLFSLERDSQAGLVLILKPTSLAPGLATRMIGLLATGAWDSQPDDLQRLDLPPDLQGTNLVGALGPTGAGLYDLVSAGTLSVVQGLGDAGGMVVRFRGDWCSVAGTGAPIPFRLEELVARLQPLL